MFTDNRHKYTAGNREVKRVNMPEVRNKLFCTAVPPVPPSPVQSGSFVQQRQAAVVAVVPAELAPALVQTR